MVAMARAQTTRSTRGPAAAPGRLLAAVGMVALLGGMAAIVISSRGTGDVPLPAATTAATAAQPKPTPTRPAAVRIAVSGVGAYDPDGDQSENDGDAGLATDGNRATAWKSERYRSSFGKTGVGLVVDAGRPVRASRVSVTTETPGYDAEIRIADSPSGPFVAVSGSKATTPRTTFVLKPRRGRYLMLWITSMPEAGAAAVNEITVTAGG